jgi:hypothetical protein
MIEDEQIDDSQEKTKRSHVQVPPRISTLLYGKLRTAPHVCTRMYVRTWSFLTAAATGMVDDDRRTDKVTSCVGTVNDMRRGEGKAKGRTWTWQTQKWARKHSVVR